MIEDIFTDNLVDEPDDIERVIEDGEERRRDSDAGSGEDKKEDEDKKEKEKTKIRKTTGPRQVLNPERLKGPRGIATMEEFFKGVKLDGRRGKEEKDLDAIMKRMELWTHRLYPRGQFDDCLKKIEKLGSKKIIKNYVTRIRLGMEDGSGESDIVREEPLSPPPPADNDHPHLSSNDDVFDRLMSSSSGTEVTSRFNTHGTNMDVSHQGEELLMNRQVADERRAARIKKAQELKMKYLAKRAQSSQSANVAASTNGPQQDVTLEQQARESEENVRSLQMEVDYMPASTTANSEIDYDESNKALNKENGIIQSEKSAEKLELMCNQTASTREMEEVSNDGADSGVCSCEENSETNSNGKIDRSVKNIVDKTVEEMDICEATSSCHTDKSVKTTVNHIFSEVEIKLKEESDIVKLKVSNESEKQVENEMEIGYFEKENEIPNLC